MGYGTVGPSQCLGSRYEVFNTNPSLIDPISSGATLQKSEVGPEPSGPARRRGPGQASFSAEAALGRPLTPSVHPSPIPLLRKRGLEGRAARRSEGPSTVLRGAGGTPPGDSDPRIIARNNGTSFVLFRPPLASKPEQLYLVTGSSSRLAACRRKLPPSLHSVVAPSSFGVSSGLMHGMTARST